MSDERKDVTITVRVDQSLKSEMDERPKVNWSAVARKAIRRTIDDLEVMDEIAAENRMTEADAKEISDRISEDANDRARAARGEDAVENRADGGTALDRSGDVATSSDEDVETDASE
jgi:hypothetical protein